MFCAISVIACFSNIDAKTPGHPKAQLASWKVQGSPRLHSGRSSTDRGSHRHLRGHRVCLSDGQHLAMASNNKIGGDSTGQLASADSVQAAVIAAKQLSAAWKTGPYSKLLQRPAPAVWEGKADAALSHTLDLLAAMRTALTAQHSAASTEQLLRSLEQQQAAKLMAQLVVWLQQGSEVAAEHAAGGSCSSSSSQAVTLWRACMAFFDDMRNFLSIYQGRRSSDALPHVEHFAMALSSAGTAEQSAVAGLSQQRCGQHRFRDSTVVAPSCADVS